MPGGFIYPRDSGSKLQSQTVNHTKGVAFRQQYSKLLCVDFTAALCKDKSLSRTVPFK